MWFLIAIMTLVGGLLLSNCAWYQDFAQRLAMGKIEEREEEIQRIVHGTTGEYLASRPVEIELPKGRIYKKLRLRLRGTLTIGVNPATSVQPHGMQRALRQIELTVHRGKGANRIYQGNLMDYNPRGVNDAAGGRTASFAGIALYREALVMNGAPLAQTDPALAVAAHTVEAIWELNFLQQNPMFPWRTLLDTTKVADARVRFYNGILETTAAGDDTDLLVNPAGTTNTFTGEWTLTGESLVNVPSYPFDVKLMRTISDNLTVGSAQRVDLGEDTLYRRLFMHVTDDDVDSDLRVQDVAFILDNKDRIVDKSWYDLQQAAKGRYGIETWPTGFATMEFDPHKIGAVRDVFGWHDARLELNNPAGAVAAEDRIHVIAEEVRRHPNRGGR